jgi:hypothetical protein
VRNRKQIYLLWLTPKVFEHLLGEQLAATVIEEEAVDV